MVVGLLPRVLLLPSVKANSPLIIIIVVIMNRCNHDGDDDDIHHGCRA
jgi:hypothetical protein